jgi:hypothetical protein
MSWLVAVHVEECFIEATAKKEQDGELTHQRWFVPHQVHFSNLFNWATSLAGDQPICWLLSTTRPKVYSQKGLGTPPIILVDQPYEEWLLQASKYRRDRCKKVHWHTKHFALQRDHIFSTSHHQPMSDEDCHALLSKFLLLNHSEIVLLMSEKNSSLRLSKSLLPALQEAQMRVFNPPKHKSLQETESHWWTAVLNAFTYSTVAQIVENWQTTQSKNQLLQLVDEQLNCSPDFSPDKAFTYSFAHYRSVGKTHPDCIILLCGLEEWVLIDSSEQTPITNLQFAEVAVETLRHQRCTMQPTCQISPSTWGTPEIHLNEVGYEPGPILMGKGLKPSILDLICQEPDAIEITGLQLSPHSRSKQRWSESLMSFTSSRQGYGSISISDTEQDLRQQLTDSLWSDILEFNSAQSPLILSGPLAPQVKKLLGSGKVKFPIRVADNAQWCISSSLSHSLKDSFSNFSEGN